MKKSILVSLGFVGISLLILFLTREVIVEVMNPGSHFDVMKVNVVMYLTGLVGLIYLLVAVMKKRREYPALIVFVILAIVTSINNFLAITLGSYALMFMFLIMAFHILLFIAHFVIGVLMIYKNAWPVFVSVVLFLKLPGFILVLGVDRLIIQYFYKETNSYDAYSSFSNVYMIIGLIATTIMLFVLYYEKEDALNER